MSAAITAAHIENGASSEEVDMRFEAVVIPVADVDRSKEFSTKLGWRIEADFPFDSGFRKSSSRLPVPRVRFGLARR
jgi:hypothetical protein